jgi:hypothetical protein
MLIKCEGGENDSAYRDNIRGLRFSCAGRPIAVDVIVVEMRVDHVFNRLTGDLCDRGFDLVPTFKVDGVASATPAHTRQVALVSDLQ